MPEVITTLVSVEKKAGSNERGSYTLGTFKDTEGKQYKSFNDDVISKGESLFGQAVAIDFTVKSRQWDGRTLVDNMIVSLGVPGEVTSSSNGDATKPVSPNPPIQNRIFAFKAAVDLLAAMPEMFGEENPNFVGLTKIADAIYDWAKHSEKAPEPDPEPEPEPVTN